MRLSLSMIRMLSIASVACAFDMLHGAANLMRGAKTDLWDVPIVIFLKVFGLVMLLGGIKFFLEADKKRDE